MMRTTQRQAYRATYALFSAAVALLVVSGCGAQRFPARHPMGVPLRGTSRYEKELELFKGIKAAHKSLAMAGVRDGIFVLGYSTCDATSAEVAMAEALADCEKRRHDRRIEAPCRTIPVGDAVQP